MGQSAPFSLIAVADIRLGMSFRNEDGVTTPPVSLKDEKECRIGQQMLSIIRVVVVAGARSEVGAECQRSVWVLPDSYDELAENLSIWECGCCGELHRGAGALRAYEWVLEWGCGRPRAPSTGLPLEGNSVSLSSPMFWRKDELERALVSLFHWSSRWRCLHCHTGGYPATRATRWVGAAGKGCGCLLSHLTLVEHEQWERQSD